MQEELEGAKGAGVLVVQRESESGESGEAAEDVKMVVEEEVVGKKRTVSEKVVDQEEVVQEKVVAEERGSS